MGDAGAEVCTACGRLVPPSNRDLHVLRCSKDRLQARVDQTVKKDTQVKEEVEERVKREQGIEEDREGYRLQGRFDQTVKKEARVKEEVEERVKHEPGIEEDMEGYSNLFQQGQFQKEENEGEEEDIADDKKPKEEEDQDEEGEVETETGNIEDDPKGKRPAEEEGEGFGGDETEDCPICYDELPPCGNPTTGDENELEEHRLIGQTGCTHKFHLPCIKTWASLPTGRTCPMCRRILSEIIVTLPDGTYLWRLQAKELKHAQGVEGGVLVDGMYEVTDSDDDDDDDERVCEICERDDRPAMMLQCRGDCGEWYHRNCIRPRPRITTNWQCSRCRARAARDRGAARLSGAARRTGRGADNNQGPVAQAAAQRVAARPQPVHSSALSALRAQIQQERSQRLAQVPQPAAGERPNQPSSPPTYNRIDFRSGTVLPAQRPSNVAPRAQARRSINSVDDVLAEAQEAIQRIDQRFQRPQKPLTAVERARLVLQRMADEKREREERQARHLQSVLSGRSIVPPPAPQRTAARGGMAGARGGSTNTVVGGVGERPPHPTMAQRAQVGEGRREPDAVQRVQGAEAGREGTRRKRSAGLLWWGEDDWVGEGKIPKRKKAEKETEPAQKKVGGEGGGSLPPKPKTQRVHIPTSKPKSDRDYTPPPQQPPRQKLERDYTPLPKPKSEYTPPPKQNSDRNYTPPPQQPPRQTLARDFTPPPKQPATQKSERDYTPPPKQKKADRGYIPPPKQTTPNRDHSSPFAQGRRKEEVRARPAPHPPNAKGKEAHRDTPTSPPPPPSSQHTPTSPHPSTPNDNKQHVPQHGDKPRQREKGPSGGEDSMRHYKEQLMAGARTPLEGAYRARAISRDQYKTVLKQAVHQLLQAHPDPQHPPSVFVMEAMAVTLLHQLLTPGPSSR